MKIIIKIISLIMIISVMTLSVYAISYDEFKISVDEKMSEITLPDEIIDSEIELNNYENISKIDSDSIFSFIRKVIASSIKSPIKLFISVLVICLLGSILSTFSSISEDVMIVITFLCVMNSILYLISDSLSAIKSLSTFLISYVPIYASLCITSGNIGGAMTYNSTVLFICDLAVVGINTIVIPLLICAFVLSVSELLNNNMIASSKLISKLLTSVFGFVMTVFTAVIGIQSRITSSKYTVGIRAGKYLISSFVPVIGNTINESSEMVKSSIETIKSTVGIFGIIIISMTLSIPIITISLYNASLLVSQSLASVFGMNKISKLLEALVQTLNMLKTVYIFLLLMLTISSGILLRYPN